MDHHVQQDTQSADPGELERDDCESNETCGRDPPNGGITRCGADQRSCRCVVHEDHLFLSPSNSPDYPTVTLNLISRPHKMAFPRPSVRLVPANTTSKPVRILLRAVKQLLDRP